MSTSFKRDEKACSHSSVRSTACSVLKAALLAATFASPLAAQSAHADTDVERCERPIGTLAVAEPRADHMAALHNYNLASPSALLRSIVQKSGCFVVVDRGAGLAMARAERELGRDDELQAGSNMGKGQMKAADYTLNPTVQFSNGNAGGVGAVLGGVIGRKFPMIGGMAGGLKFKSAETNIEIVDTRTTVQLVATQGKARGTSFSVGALGVLGLGGAVGAYGNTNEGKVVAASFVDNFNNIVRELRANSQLMAQATTISCQHGRDVAASAVFTNGDVLAPKIQGVRVLAEPKEAGKVLVVLSSTDNVVYLGAANDDFVSVMAPTGKGWVLRALLERRR